MFMSNDGVYCCCRLLRKIKCKLACCLTLLSEWLVPNYVKILINWVYPIPNKGHLLIIVMFCFIFGEMLTVSADKLHDLSLHALLSSWCSKVTKNIFGFYVLTLISVSICMVMFSLPHMTLSYIC